MRGEERGLAPGNDFGIAKNLPRDASSSRNLRCGMKKSLVFYLRMNNQTFRIIIEPDSKGFHGYVPALPGCHTWGKSIAETKKHLREAMELFIECLLEQGEDIPEDNSYESFETVLVKKSVRRTKSSVRQYA